MSHKAGAFALRGSVCMAACRLGVLLVCALSITACALFEEPPPPQPRSPVPVAQPPAPSAYGHSAQAPATSLPAQRQQPSTPPLGVNQPPTQPIAGAAADRGGYRLGVGDVIRISVHGEPDLTVDVRIGESGIVNYPFLGDIRVIGMTVSQLERTIDRGLRGDYLVNPDVRVLVTAYRYFYVNGEVRTPGGYPYVPGLTVRQAVTLAGGLTERASSRRITVYRETNPSVPVEATLDTVVEPGDIVVVDQGLF
ncbi:polysaccharide biosynthesis/export family protein [Sinimarinibacterium thermocellulolyticum]|uniref:Polysaccharide biosynthesis/export family protein n=1 Tax=Sinimarinibacterium thermocellulolyticum TaxID=3170016 RepID=A0ABV2A9J2_9GAMM